MDGLRKKAATGMFGAAIGLGLLSGAATANTEQLVEKYAQYDILVTEANVLDDLSPGSLISALALKLEDALAVGWQPPTTEAQWIKDRALLLQSETWLIDLQTQLNRQQQQLQKISPLSKQLQNKNQLETIKLAELEELMALWQDSHRLLELALQARRDVLLNSPFSQAHNEKQAQIATLAEKRRFASANGLVVMAEQHNEKIAVLCRELAANNPHCSQTQAVPQKFSAAIKVIKEQNHNRCVNAARHPDCLRLDQILALNPANLDELTREKKLELEQWAADQLVAIKGGF